MLEFILAKTNLPNLHPAIVHFPVVLLLVALALDIAALFLTSRQWLRKSALLLWVLGAIAAGVTFLSGRQAATTVDVPRQAEVLLARHENFALYTLWFFGIYAVIRITLEFVTYRKWVHILMILIALAGQGLLFQTADLGGGLVFKHAVGVTMPKMKEPIAAKPSPNAGPQIKPGEIVWKFTPGSEEKITEFLEAQKGSLNGVQFKTEQKAGKTFLVIQKPSADPLLLTFQLPFHDLHVESELDRSEFKGAIFLVHHSTPNEFDYLAIEQSALELGRQSGKQKKIFGREEVKIPPGFHQFRAVASGSHFRGYMHGKLMVHGHGKAAPEGKAGLLLEGTGTLRIVQISIHTLKEEHQM